MSWFRARRMTIDEARAAAVGMNPEQICDFVRERVRYRRERKDRWQPPEETLKRGRGDCEDFALLVRDLCLAAGHECRLVVVFQGVHGEGHAINVGSGWLASSGVYRIGSPSLAGICIELGWESPSAWMFDVSAAQIERLVRA